MKIRYVFGDFTEPHGFGPRVLVNLCNTNGEWKGTHAVSIAKKFKNAKTAFRSWFKDHKKNRASQPFELGQAQIVDVTKRGWFFDRNLVPSLWVANILGLEGEEEGYRRPFRPGAIKLALGRVASFAQSQHAIIHMPKIGSQLHEGGKWDIVEEIINSEVIGQRVAVVVYDIK